MHVVCRRNTAYLCVDFTKKKNWFLLTRQATQACVLGYTIHLLGAYTRDLAKFWDHRGIWSKVSLVFEDKNWGFLSLPSWLSILLVVLWNLRSWNTPETADWCWKSKILNGLAYTEVISYSWNFLSWAEPKWKGSEPSPVLARLI